MKLVSWCADVAPFLCGSPRDILVGHSELRGSSKLSPHEGIVSESLEPLLASSLIPVLTQRHAALSHEKTLSTSYYELPKKRKKELQWIVQSSSFKYCIETSGVSLFHVRIKSHAGMKEYHKS